MYVAPKQLVPVSPVEHSGHCCGGCEWQFFLTDLPSSSVSFLYDPWCSWPTFTPDLAPTTVEGWIPVISPISVTLNGSGFVIQPQLIQEAPRLTQGHSNIKAPRFLLVWCPPCAGFGLKFIPFSCKRTIVVVTFSSHMVSMSFFEVKKHPPQNPGEYFSSCHIDQIS